MLFCCFFSTALSASGTTVVISQGIGSTVEGAIQNSAERALMQVVGSYIDTQTMISKRKEIKDGVKTQTKNITSETLQISNGSIKEIDVLEVVEDGNLFRVEATVEVKIDDVKVLIEPFLVAKTEVSKGLFAGISKNKSQAQDRSKLITKRIIKPLLSGKYIEAKILGVVPLGQEIELVPTWLKKLGRDGYYLFPNFLLAALDGQFGENTNFHKEYFKISEAIKRQIRDDESVVVLAYETQLSEELQQQITTILKEVSLTSYRLDFLSPSRLNKFLKNHQKSETQRAICTFQPMHLDCYVIDVGRPQQNYNEFNVNNYLAAQWNEKVDRALTYRTLITLLDDKNSEVIKDFISYAQSYNEFKYRFNSLAYKKRNRHLNSGQPIVKQGFFDINSILFIPFISNDLVYMRIPDEQLSIVNSLEITTEASPDFLKQTLGEDY